MLREWDNGGKKMKLNQAEFTGMGSLNRDSVFNIAAWRVRNISNSWLTG